jgi:hypothetical protein
MGKARSTFWPDGKGGLRAARLLNDRALAGEIKEVSKPEEKLPSIGIERESWVEEAGKYNCCVAPSGSKCGA